MLTRTVANRGPSMAAATAVGCVRLQPTPSRRRALHVRYIIGLRASRFGRQVVVLGGDRAADQRLHDEIVDCSRLSDHSGITFARVLRVFVVRTPYKEKGR